MLLPNADDIASAFIGLIVQCDRRNALSMMHPFVHLAFNDDDGFATNVVQAKAALEQADYAFHTSLKPAGTGITSLSDNWYKARIIFNLPFNSEKNWLIDFQIAHGLVASIRAGWKSGPMLRATS